MALQNNSSSKNIDAVSSELPEALPADTLEKFSIRTMSDDLRALKKGTFQTAKSLSQDMSAQKNLQPDLIKKESQEKTASAKDFLSQEKSFEKKISSKTISDKIVPRTIKSQTALPFSSKAEEDFFTKKPSQPKKNPPQNPASRLFNMFNKKSANEKKNQNKPEAPINAPENKIVRESFVPEYKNSSQEKASVPIKKPEEEKAAKQEESPFLNNKYFGEKKMPKQEEPPFSIKNYKEPEGSAVAKKKANSFFAIKKDDQQLTNDLEEIKKEESALKKQTGEERVLLATSEKETEKLETENKKIREDIIVLVNKKAEEEKQLAKIKMEEQYLADEIKASQEKQSILKKQVEEARSALITSTEDETRLEKAYKKAEEELAVLTKKKAEEEKMFYVAKEEEQSLASELGELQEKQAYLKKQMEEERAALTASREEGEQLEAENKKLLEEIAVMVNKKIEAEKQLALTKEEEQYLANELRAAQEKQAGLKKQVEVARSTLILNQQDETENEYKKNLRDITIPASKEVKEEKHLDVAKKTATSTLEAPKTEAFSFLKETEIDKSISAVSSNPQQLEPPQEKLVVPENQKGSFAKLFFTKNHSSIKDALAQETGKHRSLFIVGFSVFFLMIFSLGIYYIFIRKPESIIITPPPAEENPVVTTPTTGEKKEKYSPDKTNFLFFDPTDEDLSDLKKVLASIKTDLNNAAPRALYSFSVFDNNYNKVTFPMFAAAVKFNLSPALLENLGEDFLLFFYNDDSKIRLAVAVAVKNEALVAAEMLKQEETLSSDAEFLFLGNEPENNSGKFGQGFYRGAAVKYLNLSQQNTFSIDYIINDASLVIGTSKNTAQAVFDSLSIKGLLTEDILPTEKQENDSGD